MLKRWRLLALTIAVAAIAAAPAHATVVATASQADLTYDQVGGALANLGNYRVLRVQQIAHEGSPDHVGASTMLAVGLRETLLRNLEGGAVFVDGRWVAQPDPAKRDVGFTQISRVYHRAALADMPGVKCGTWKPLVSGKTAADDGYCGRFSDEAFYTRDELRTAEHYGATHGVADRDLTRFIIAAHNAGSGGALRGYREGDVDRYTTGGDYSAWCLRHVGKIHRWLNDHPNWRA